MTPIDQWTVTAGRKWMICLNSPPNSPGTYIKQGVYNDPDRTPHLPTNLILHPTNIPHMDLIPWSEDLYCTVLSATPRQYSHCRRGGSLFHTCGHMTEGWVPRERFQNRGGSQKLTPTTWKFAMQRSTVSSKRPSRLQERNKSSEKACFSTPPPYPSS